MTPFLARRLLAQQIARRPFSAASDLVHWLGAVQAQDYAAAKWAVGLRLARATDASIEAELARGAVLRTHAFRWTWQLVSPADIHWILALVGPRLLARAARRHAELGLDAATLRKCRRMIERALRDGACLTRRELSAALRGIDCTGQRLPHILAVCELEGLICSGRKKATWELLDRRAPKTRALSRDEALAELARRYFRSRGPATIADFIWWSGLSSADARAGLASVESELAQDVFDGRVHWRADQPLVKTEAAYLLPAFDEYLVAYRERGAMLDPRHVKRLNAGGGLLAPCVVKGGRVVGLWRRDAKTITIERLLPCDRESIEAAARRYEAFVGASPPRAIVFG
jgi:winged helix DNA-binding protein